LKTQRLLDTCASTESVFNQLGDDLDGAEIGGKSGASVSLSYDGQTVAIGAPLSVNMGVKAGQVKVSKYRNGEWVQKGDIIPGELNGDQSGSSVSLSADGNIVAVGAWCNDEAGNASGQVRVFKYDGSVWIKQGNDIYGENKNDRSGFSVSTSMDGMTVAIGAWGSDSQGKNSGHVRVFTFDGRTWNQKGLDIDGKSGGDRSGFSVNINDGGSIVAVGATHNDDNGQNSGQVRVFEYTGSKWIQLGEDINGETIADRAGWSVSLSPGGFKIAIGAIHNDDNGSNSGNVRVFRFNGTTWVQWGDAINGEANDDKSGWSVSLANNDVLAVGAPYHNDGSMSNSGHVRIFTWDDNNWKQIGEEIIGEAAGDWFGKSVSLSSDGLSVAIGAEQNDSNGNLSGNVRVMEICAENVPIDPIPYDEYNHTVADAFVIGSPYVEFRKSENEIEVEQGIGINATNPDRPTKVFVYLRESGSDNKCSGPKITDTTVTVSDYSFSPDSSFAGMTGKFGYDINLDLKTFSVSDLVTFANGDRSSGSIIFCAQVVTEYSEVEITFQKTRFTLGFDLSEVTIQLGTLEIVELDPLIEENDDFLEMSVDACVCDRNLKCITTPILSIQNTEIMFCLRTNSDNVEIKSFGLSLKNKGNNYKYTAVQSKPDGTGWIPQVPTTVLVIGEVIRITTIAVAGLFDDSNEDVLVEGVATLGFIGGGNVLPSDSTDNCGDCARSSTLHGFEMVLDVKAKNKENTGCIGQMLNNFKEFLKIS